ncbi:MAG: HEAT repeat domain-containing protein, partial [Dehalococcoidia bacterium]|nr:HEAT repeat domain-containing protein [Dehalococcoidia bacterium]
MSKKKHVVSKPASAAPGEAEAVEELRRLAALVFEQSQPPAGVMAQFVDRIDNLPPTAVSRLLRSLAQEAGENALPLLDHLAKAPKPAIAVASIEALASVRSERSAEILTRLADADASRQGRKEAKRALFKLRSLGVAVDIPLAGTAVAKERFPVLRTLLSSFDGRGTRAVIFGIERPFDAVERIFLMLSDSKGLTDCSKVDMSRATFAHETDHLINETLRGGIWAEAPASYCRQLVHEALTLNARSGTPVPRGYFYIKDEIGRPTEHFDRPLIYRDLTALEVKWDPTLLEHSGELLDRNEFADWAFALDEVGPYFIEMQQPRRSAITLPGASQKDRDEEVARRFFQAVVTPERHAAYKRELEETAYLFLRHDRRLDAKLALAAAVAMDELHGGELIRVPFFRYLLARSFALFEREVRGGS